MHIVLTQIKGIADYSANPIGYEHITMPSVVEPVHNLSIEEIVRDYSRGIVHSSKVGLYDEGEDIVEVEKYDDISDIIPNREERIRKSVSSRKSDEVGKPRVNDEDETKRSLVTTEEVTQDPGPKED